MKSGRGTAHGKIILMGEHAVVYQKPSIALPFFDAGVTTTVKQSAYLDLSCDFYQGLVTEMPELLNSVKAAIQTSLQELGHEDATLHIDIESTIPIERGMGSSAAVAVATTRALFDYYQQPLSQEQLLAIVNIAETIAHGNPSGLDALMTSSNQAYRYVKGQPFTPIQSNLEATLVIADTGKTGQTKEAVSAVKELMLQSQYQAKIQQLGQLTIEAEQCLITNSAPKLGQLMTEAQQLLTDLTVSSPELNQLTEVALKTGAYGAKLTGGGRGGCMIALCSDEQAESVNQSLQQAGAVQTWMLPMKGI